MRRRRGRGCCRRIGRTFLYIYISLYMVAGYVVVEDVWLRGRAGVGGRVTGRWIDYACMIGQLCINIRYDDAASKLGFGVGWMEAANAA